MTRAPHGWRYTSQTGEILFLVGDRAMTCVGMRGCLLISSAVIGMIAASCGSGPDHAVRIDRQTDGHVLTFHVREIEGQCYAPQSVMFDGSLSLDDFDGVDRWMLAAVDPGRVEGLSDMLSAKRARIGRRPIEVFVPEDAVLKRPSYVQFVAFSCEARVDAKDSIGKVSIVSVAADLPPFDPDGRRADP